MGKKKDINEEEIKDMVLPVANDVLGVATRLLDFDRVWIKMGGAVLVSPWNFQSHKFSDAIWRYRKSQAKWLRKNGYFSI